MLRIARQVVLLLRIVAHVVQLEISGGGKFVSSLEARFYRVPGEHPARSVETLSTGKRPDE